MKSTFFAGFFLLAFVLQGFFVARSMSPTADEVTFNLVNGYVGLKTGDYRMSPANPALTRQWLALPWLACNLKLDLQKKSWKDAESIDFSNEFFYHDNRAIASKLLIYSRMMALVLGALIGALIYFWSRKIYGEWGGLLSLSLYAFCPVFIAHSSLGGTDIGVSFFSLLTFYFLWCYLETATAKNFWFFCASFGVACAAKQNALVFIPVVLGIVWKEKGFKVALRALTGVAFCSFLAVWISYGFEFKPLLWNGVPRQEEKIGYLTQIASHFPFLGQVLSGHIEFLAKNVSIPIPTYILGVMGVVRSHQAPYYHYAFGHWGTQTQWYFYLFSFAARMTLPFLILFILRALVRPKLNSGFLKSGMVLMAPVLFYFAVTMRDTTNVGIRYLFPVIPLIFIWIGGLAEFGKNSRLWKIVLAVGVLLNTVSALSVFPNNFSYFNEAIGGVKGGYRFVRGSDVDWGQGAKSLKRFMDEQGLSKISLEYFGPSENLSFYGINHESLSESEKMKPEKKVYAFGLFYLERAEWTRNKKPDAVIGGSIFLYDFRNHADIV